MYDMYPWDSASQGDYPPRPLRSWRNPARKAATAATAAQATTPSHDISPVQAIQVALDRRDNGGDAAQSVSQSTTAPAASQARQ
jgi:hypothetical protein